MSKEKTEHSARFGKGGGGEFTILQGFIAVSIFFIVCAVMKLTGHTEHTWWMVTAPLWVGIPQVLIIKGFIYLISKITP